MTISFFLLEEIQYYHKISKFSTHFFNVFEASESRILIFQKLLSSHLLNLYYLYSRKKIRYKMKYVKFHDNNSHYVKSVRIWSCSGPYFLAFGLNTERYGVSSVRMLENTDQSNSEYGHFLRSEHMNNTSQLK